MTKVIGDDIQVFLVDKGEHSLVKTDDMRLLPKDFTKLPQIALPCQLTGIKAPNGENRFSGIRVIIFHLC